MAGLYRPALVPDARRRDPGQRRVAVVGPGVVAGVLALGAGCTPPPGRGRRGRRGGPVAPSERCGVHRGHHRRLVGRPVAPGRTGPAGPGRPGLAIAVGVGLLLVARRRARSRPVGPHRELAAGHRAGALLAAHSARRSASPTPAGSTRQQTRSQTWVLLLVLVGIGAVSRCGAASGRWRAFAVWSAIVIGAWLSPGDRRRRPGHAVLLPRDAAHLVARLPARTGAGRARGGAGGRPGRRARPPSPAAAGVVGRARARHRGVRRLRRGTGRRVRPGRRGPWSPPGYRTPEFVRIGPDDDAAAGSPPTSGRGNASSTRRTTGRPTSTSSAASRSSTSTRWA